MDGVQVAAEDQVRTCPQAAVFQYSPIAIQPQGVDHSPGGQLGGGALRACADAHSLQVMDINAPVRMGDIQLEVLEKTAATARRSSLVGALSSVP